MHEQKHIRNISVRTYLNLLPFFAVVMYHSDVIVHSCFMEVCLAASLNTAVDLLVIVQVL
jgi:hypothetical protein